MRKLILLLSFLPFFTTSFSQLAYFSIGNNFSKYNFESSSSSMTTPLKTGSGSNYELGISKSLHSEQVFYSIGINLNEYNASAGNKANSYSWNTRYLGINNSLDCHIPLFGDLEMMIRGGLNFSHIVFGKQSINGAIYDLVKQKEFAGLSVSPFAHFQLTYPFKHIGSITLGYGVTKNFFPSNRTDEKLSISTNQVRFGILFKIK